MNLSCKDAARLLSEKRDRRLPWRTRVSLRFHMLMCKMCQVYGTQLSAVSRVCQEAGLRADDYGPEYLSDEHKRRMKDALTQEPGDR